MLRDQSLRAGVEAVLFLKPLALLQMKQDIRLSKRNQPQSLSLDRNKHLTIFNEFADVLVSSKRRIAAFIVK